ncbi:potassium channel protein [Flammeovirga pectinis]|uniref:Potassium channel protein n=1 Tax=Flammeovirga pectinis TaxID=2494373 RepID=A0A3S9P1L3_9BACT|nr:potassium channel protein [Flammeovirga pectinis]AZQ62083.1 potassium channel protein [Flammeovirga pectinis]
MRALLAKVLPAFGVIFFIMIIGTVGFMATSSYPVEPMDAFFMTAITITTIGYGEVIPLDNNPVGRVFAIFIAFSGIGTFTYIATSLSAFFLEGHIQEEFFKRRTLRMINTLNNHFVICGLGRVGLRIAEELDKADKHFVFIEKDEEIYRQYRREYKHAYGIVGDCTMDETLISAGIKQASGIFICTNDDNLNLVTTLTARQLNADFRIVSANKKPAFRDKLISVGANEVVSPHSIGGRRMAMEMIRPNITTFLDVVRRDKTELFKLEEISIPENCHGKSLKDLKIHELPSTLVLAIREGQEWYFKPSIDQHFTSKSVLLIMTNEEEKAYIKERLSII